MEPLYDLAYVLTYLTDKPLAAFRMLGWPSHMRLVREQDKLVVKDEKLCTSVLFQAPSNWWDIIWTWIGDGPAVDNEVPPPAQAEPIAPIEPIEPMDPIKPNMTQEQLREAFPPPKPGDVTVTHDPDANPPVRVEADVLPEAPAGDIKTDGS